ncbi:hypothetical protein [Amycolatopsis sp. NPDC004079]|uniref:hypothetical protein n=1 Tax=Amycolatopsis sp. NPDC004079 TaxID=3154549 RepID=UPI0033B0A81E
MPQPKDHRVTMTTRNGDTNTRAMTEEDARRAEDLQFDDASNIAVVTVQPPRTPW